MEDRKWCVYIHISPSNKAYIGITSLKPEYRWGKDGKSYLRKNNDGQYKQPLMAHAVLKYNDWSKWEHIIFYDNLSKEKAEDIEVKLIALYNTNDPKYGYNINLGGNIGMHGRKHTDETKRKMSKSMLKRNQFVGEKNYNYGKHPSGKWKDSIIETNKTRIIKHYVLCIDTGEIFNNLMHAERETGISHSNISRCCNGIYKTAGGYQWRKLTQEEVDKL